jgi:hypothetical protein
VPLPSDRLASRAAPVGATTRRTAAPLGWLLAVLMMASACGSSAPSEGARYEQIVNPANTAWAAFVTQARTWPGGAIPASGTALTQHVVKTWEQVNGQLLTIYITGQDRPIAASPPSCAPTPRCAGR